jgi:hypothetical protein
MFIKYDEYELLELFENEPVVIGDKEAGMFIYSKNDAVGFKLVLTVSIYEKECELILTYQNFNSSIFDIKLKDVDRITCKNQKLSLLSIDDEKSIEVTFKPTFALKTFVL